MSPEQTTCSCGTCTIVASAPASARPIVRNSRRWPSRSNSGASIEVGTTGDGGNCPANMEFQNARRPGVVLPRASSTTC